MEEKRELVKKALDMRSTAYAPYSKFTVGAVLLCQDGDIYTGCNIENAAYTPCNCAERTAFFKAVSEGKRSFRMLAVAGGKKGEKPRNFCMPCGVCRQVMEEFCRGDFTVIVAKSETEYKEYRLEELLPLAFGLEALEETK